MAAGDKQATPPYLSYVTFKGAIQGLSLDGRIPRQIDHSVLRTTSGSVRKMFLAALRFFDLIDENGAPGDNLEILASADEKTWRECMATLLTEYYPRQIEHLSDGSPKQLTESFQSSFEGIGASIVSPAVRFLVAAARDAGLPVSGHIAQRQVPASAGTRRRNRKSARQNSVEDPPIAAKPSPSSFAMAMLAKFPEFDPTWNETQQKAWFAAYERLLSLDPERAKGGGNNG